MEKNPNYFKQFLEKSYQETFLDPTGKQGKNPITKINGCVRDNILLGQNTIIILTNGCYSKMSQSNIAEIYSECLQQYEPNDEQIKNIINCVGNVSPA